jgi:hypothetical protein
MVLTNTIGMAVLMAKTWSLPVTAVAMDIM